jgi:hypothetical protein
VGLRGQPTNWPLRICPVPTSVSAAALVESMATQLQAEHAGHEAAVAEAASAAVAAAASVANDEAVKTQAAAIAEAELQRTRREMDELQRALEDSKTTSVAASVDPTPAAIWRWWGVLHSCAGENRRARKLAVAVSAHSAAQHPPRPHTRHAAGIHEGGLFKIGGCLF